MTRISDNLTVVIRAGEERTTDLCLDLLHQQIDPGACVVIRERPFFNAVHKCFEIGAKSGTPYLHCLDADILLYHGALAYMLQVAETHMDDSVFRIDFPIMDKFRGRTIGTHFYNNKYSADILNAMDSDPEAPHLLRAESDNIVRFCQPRGLDYHLVKPTHAVASHDEHQYLAHICRKYMVRHARCQVDKDLDFILDRLARLIQAFPDDHDYEVALTTLMACITGSVDDTDEFFNSLGLPEKKPLTPDSCRSISITLQTVPMDQ